MKNNGMHTNSELHANDLCTTIWMIWTDDTKTFISCSWFWILQTLSSFKHNVCIIFFQCSMPIFKLLSELSLDIYLGSTEIPRRYITEETVGLCLSLTSKHYPIQEWKQWHKNPTSLNKWIFFSFQV